MIPSMSSKMRLDAILARLGYCSRSEAKRWINQGRCVYQGLELYDSSFKVCPEDLLIDNQPPEFPHGVCVAFNKPPGLTCSHDPREAPLIYEILPPRWPKRNPPVTSIGRLDKQTCGLLILTDDGKLVQKLTSPRHDVPKLYRFSCDVAVPAHAAELFAAGELLLEGEKNPLKPAKFEQQHDRGGLLQLREGRYHQVRRMLAHLGCEVLELERLSIGGLRLADLDLQQGQWRSLQAEQLALLDAREDLI